MSVDVRLGEPIDVDLALSIYERSNLARRQGLWPHRAERVNAAAAMLHKPDSWFLLRWDDAQAMAMALVSPFREDGGRGAVVPRTSFLNLIYVVPERWGEGIGGTILDAVISESVRRGAPRIHLWTHERDNERAQRLYPNRGFARTGQTLVDDDGNVTAEWVREPPEQTLGLRIRRPSPAFKGAITDKVVEQWIPGRRSTQCASSATSRTGPSRPITRPGS